MTTSVPAVRTRASGVAAAIGGAAIIGLGIVSAVEPNAAGDAWFIAAAGAVGLIVAGVLGLRRVVAAVPVARRALTVAAVALALFGLAHFYALIDPETGVVLFSVFMVPGALAVVVAGVAILRARLWRGARGLVPLVCGIWPLATIPVGAALGDVPHFLAIAAWGVWWVALGVILAGGTQR